MTGQASLPSQKRAQGEQRQNAGFMMRVISNDIKCSLTERHVGTAF
uniref:Uncharacterized protein n=1 Tax=Vibrio splendidus TaxID=29497 RepID=A0A0H3ZN70_VIBSP|nr:hypothetical protein [Vibrio splendidus]